ncbi:MAG: Type 1 glutamine amidotransferase-like domain-containing protein, partial [Clostridia bacterium]|nr:Type 1 glutamine amidotransferase-like domain-containing protein [Clostridia bacterium]
TGYPGVIMGISAGTMNAAEVVYAQPEADGESSPSFLRFYPGLGLTEIMVCPHYQEVVEKNMTVDGIPIYPDITAADSHRGYPFHVFPDGTYIYKDENEYAIYGQCWRYHNGILEQLTKDGECLDLQ